MVVGAVYIDMKNKILMLSYSFVPNFIKHFLIDLIEKVKRKF